MWILWVKETVLWRMESRRAKRLCVCVKTAGPCTMTPLLLPLKQDSALLPCAVRTRICTQHGRGAGTEHRPVSLEAISVLSRIFPSFSMIFFRRAGTLEESSVWSFASMFASHLGIDTRCDMVFPSNATSSFTFHDLFLSIKKDRIVETATQMSLWNLYHTQTLVSP